MSSQREEKHNEILVFFRDESYGHEADHINCELYDEEISIRNAASTKYKAELCDEFQVAFFEANIGPGADMPAFFTIISNNIFPLIPWLFAAFFSGKPIIDNIKAWESIYLYIKRYFSRPVYLNRQGAAVVAIGAILESLEQEAYSIKLNKYLKNVSILGKELKDNTNIIEEAAPTLNLSKVIHAFEIEVNEIKFHVIIDGKKVKIKRISNDL